MDENVIHLQDQANFSRGCYDKATQANVLGMPEQYLFSPAAKKIFPSLLNWTGKMLYTKGSKLSSSKLFISLIYKITSQLADAIRAAP